MRYDQTTRNFLAAVHLAASMICLIADGPSIVLYDRECDQRGA
jgi:hypothetical protein